jgi:hypothetical protein
MHPKIDKLIEMALADGQVTEKEHKIFLKSLKSTFIEKLQQNLKNNKFYRQNPKSLLKSVRKI